MQTVVLEEPGRLALREADRPAAGDGQVAVRIRRVGVCGTDFHAVEGVQPFFSYPRVLGHELAGEVDGRPVAVLPYLECGRCQACRRGKPNCCERLSVLGVHQDGGMTEWLTVPADHVLPADGLTLDQVVVVEPLSIGAHAVRRAGIEPGERVLVLGAGPIGLAVTRFAKLAGAEVAVTDVAPARLAFCREWAGADAVLPMDATFPDTVARWAGDRWPTAVFDATGHVGSMNQAPRWTAHGGRVVFVGLVQAALTLDDPLLHQRELTLYASRNATRDDFRRVMDAIAAGAVDADRFISRRAPLGEVPAVLPTWLKDRADLIKAVVEVA
ncbi:MAG: zinc-binding alcohol dehydrogenase family protein [Actinomycetia bacterium]|nr:zinc-binding alcohol dehydrogenase family protein [Actinomycetes bacterium]